MKEKASYWILGTHHIGIFHPIDTVPVTKVGLPLVIKITRVRRFARISSSCGVNCKANGGGHYLLASPQLAHGCRMRLSEWPDLNPAEIKNFGFKPILDTFAPIQSSAHIQKPSPKNDEEWESFHTYSSTHGTSLQRDANYVPAGRVGEQSSDWVEEK